MNSRNLIKNKSKTINNIEVISARFWSRRMDLIYHKLNYRFKIIILKIYGKRIVLQKNKRYKSNSIGMQNPEKIITSLNNLY